MYALIAANVAMFAVEVAAGASPIAPAAKQVIALGGNYPPLTLDGEWWRLGASLFLHFGALHIALNMLCLYQARAVEAVFGHAGFAVVYALAGLGGGIANLLVSSNAVSAGASGCVFGVYGAFGAKLAIHRDQFEPAAWSATVRRLGSFLALNAVIGLTASGISLSAHVGGFVVGAAAGAALLVRAGGGHARPLRALGLAALGVALTAGAVLAIPDRSATSVLRRFDDLERTAGSVQTAAYERRTAGELTAVGLADVLERELVAPYRRLRADLAAISDVPEELRPLLARTDEVVAARLAAWIAQQAMLREPDPGKQAAMREAVERAAADVRPRVDALTAEIQRLER
jgi:rhomboid protease GluP